MLCRVSEISSGDIGIRDGKMFCEETDEYRREIRKRVVDDKGNRDTTKASFLWLIDHGAITLC